ncbi:MAG: 2-hydroxyacyl-CoA dehydratase [Candidatus Omnitrophica bacterium]|nr:2-hydroxyacyl-CoA dehydratase [Candidatus Omnitrophota bacterium]
MIESLERGADTIIMVNSAGWCILRCYASAQQMILKNLGYDFKMINIMVRNPVRLCADIQRISGGVSYFRIAKEVASFFLKVNRLDAQEKEINRASPIRIGIAGEIHVCNDNTINMDIVNMLHRMGVYVDRWLSLSGNFALVFKELLGIKGFAEVRAAAREYFPEKTGGHANENLVRIIRYAQEGYDGVIVLKPFACNPETIIEPAIESISRDYGMPVICLSIDESTVETHFKTRIESFVDMLRMRKGML